MNTVYNCIECGHPLLGKQRAYCSIECKNDHFLNYEVVKKRALERKEKLIESKQGGCHRCGYSTSLDALSFYNQNGETLHIDTNILANSSYQKLYQKLAGSQVLCRNCVEEIGGLNNVNTPPNAPICEGTVQKSYSAISKTVLEKFIINLGEFPFKNNKNVVLGVSGGLDSMVMLDLFSKHFQGSKLMVAHVNHAARKESDADETFVMGMARKYGVKFVSKKLSPHQDGNMEEYFRDERRRFLLDTANNNGSGYLALAHNADDQAETFIMNAVRGSGPAGLGGMSLSEDGILRPLLNISRIEIEAYARENKLIWHEDTTNKDTSYNRSYVRHRILPLLSKLNPEYLEALGRTTYLQRGIDEHLKAGAREIIQNSFVIPAQAGIQRVKGLDSSSRAGMTEGFGLSTKNLTHLDKPLLYEVLGLLYEQAKGDRKNLSLINLQQLEELISDSAGTKSLDLPDNITAERRYEKLDFYVKKAHNNPSAPSTKKLELGEQVFGNWKVTVSHIRHPEPSEGSRTQILDSSVRPQNDERKRAIAELTIDSSLLPHLLLRTRKTGDRIATKGLAGRKRLQDLFVDAKIDRVRRETWPVVVNTATDQIIWVPGLATSNIENISKKLLTINIVEVPHETITKE